MNLNVIKPPVFKSSLNLAAVHSFRQSAWDGIQRGEVRLDSTNGPNRFKIINDLDVHRLREAISRLIIRHPVLTTSIEIREGAPWLVLPVTTPPICLDLSDGVPKNSEDLETEMGRKVWKPFDLANGPLYRVYALRFTSRAWCLGLVVHHFICDRQSVDMLMAELLALLQNPAPVPETVRPSYMDYLAVMNDWLGSEDGQSSRAVWRAHLRHLPRLNFSRYCETSLPTRDYFTLSAEVSDKIRLCAKDEKTTPFMILLAIHMVLLRAFTDERFTAVKIITSGRDARALRDMVGNLADRLYILTEATPDISFTQLVGLVHNAVSAARRNAFVRFDIVQSDLHEQGLSALAPVFNYHPPQIKRRQLERTEPRAGIKLRVAPAPEKTVPDISCAPYWMELHDHGAGMAGHIRYNSGRLAGFSEAFTRLAGACCAEPNNSLSAFMQDPWFGTGHGIV